MFLKKIKNKGKRYIRRTRAKEAQMKVHEEWMQMMQERVSFPNPNYKGKFVQVTTEEIQQYQDRFMDEVMKLLQCMMWR